MSKIDRREFLRKTTGAVGAVLGGQFLGCTKPEAGVSTPTAPAAAAKQVLHATDVVTLGKTGIQTSRLAMGTGTMGGREQRELGIDGLVKLLREGLNQGVRWWETADMYRTHPHVRAALKGLQRDRVVITTKTRSGDAAAVRGDIERFRTELGTDYIDMVLLHCMTDADWPDKMRGPMDVLSEAKDKGWVRAVGCSCHSVEALQAAADEPWIEVCLARINPFAVRMDVNSPDEVPRVEKVLQTMHERGKAVYGMKVLGQGDLEGDRIDASLRFVMARPYISGFTIGFGSAAQIDDIIRRVDRISASA